MNSDHADEDLIAEPNPLGNISAMAIDPADSKILYAIGGDKKKGVAALFVSRDEGASWTKEHDLPELAEKLWVNPQSPQNARTLLIAGPHFLMERTPSESKKITGPPAKAYTDISAGFTVGWNAGHLCDW